MGHVGLQFRLRSNFSKHKVSIAKAVFFVKSTLAGPAGRSLGGVLQSICLGILIKQKGKENQASQLSKAEEARQLA